MMTAKDAADKSYEAAHPVFLKMMEDIEKNIRDRCEDNYYYHNSMLFSTMPPAVATEVRIYLQNLGYELRNVYDGRHLEYVHINWDPKGLKEEKPWWKVW